MHYWQPPCFLVAVDRWIDTTPPGMDMAFGWRVGMTDLFTVRWSDNGTATRGYNNE